MIGVVVGVVGFIVLMAFACKCCCFARPAVRAPSVVTIVMPPTGPTGPPVIGMVQTPYLATSTVQAPYVAPSVPAPQMAAVTGVPTAVAMPAPKDATKI